MVILQTVIFVEHSARFSVSNYVIYYLITIQILTAPHFEI